MTSCFSNYSCMTDSQQTSQNLKIFSLVRLKPDCKIPPVRVDFSAPYRPNQLQTSIVPQFNPDRQHFTPSFLLPSDQKYYADNALYEKYQFEEKKQRSLKGESTQNTHHPPQELTIAQPNSHYCQVCHLNYDNYHTHVASNAHRTRTAHATVAPLILQLCLAKVATPPSEVAAGPRKHKQIRKETKREQSRRIEDHCSRRKESTQLQGKVQNFSTGMNSGGNSLLHS